MLAFHPGTESKGLIAAAAALSVDLEELGSMHLLTGSLASSLLLTPGYMVLGQRQVQSRCSLHTCSLKTEQITGSLLPVILELQGHQESITYISISLSGLIFLSLPSNGDKAGSTMALKQEGRGQSTTSRRTT